MKSKSSNQDIITTKKSTFLEKMQGWLDHGVKAAFPLGGSCCGLELQNILEQNSNFKNYAFDQIVFSPEDADMILILGTLNYKMLYEIKRIINGLSKDVRLVGIGSCAIDGGAYIGYNVPTGFEKHLTYDLKIVGCPPTIEDVILGVSQLK